jgi:hypothetical protein
LFLLTALVALLVAGCPGRKGYRAVATYRPISSSWDHVEIRVRGSRLPGHDLGNECEGILEVQTQGILRVLEVKHEASRTTVTATSPKGLWMTGAALDSGALLAVGPAMTQAEAEDILRAFDGACLGPKMGFPSTPTLRKLTEDSHYE